VLTAKVVRKNRTSIDSRLMDFRRLLANVALDLMHQKSFHQCQVALISVAECASTHGAKEQTPVIAPQDICFELSTSYFIKKPREFGRKAGSKLNGGFFMANSYLS
jgi:hypothetical protein